MSILVVDAGTSGIRAAVVRPDGSVEHVAHRRVPPILPSPGFVELDAGRLAEAALEVAGEALAAGGPVDAVGIANQRATTIVWERASGRPVGPGIGWQDVRTAGTCLALAAQGIRLAPNVSATKLAMLLDMADPGRERDLCFGTVDTWLAWTLSEGALHVTDATNAGLTGLVGADPWGWSGRLLEALRIPEAVLPEIVDSSGVLGPATALPGAPPIAGLAGDQQASLIGQGCTRPGMAKATFGTGGMLDQCVAGRPGFEQRGQGGCFPVVACQRAGVRRWGVEAVMLTAGSALDWLVEDLGLIASAADSDALAAACAGTADDVWFVPALLGLGAPVWDLGARGMLLGATRGTGKAEMARAVLAGVAHRGADLLEAAEADSGIPISSLRVDGGMSANASFLRLLADAAQRPVEVSPVLEATTLGAAYLAGLAVGTWAGEDEVAAAWKPRQVVEPGRPLDRDRWREVRGRAERAIPALSALDF